MREAVVGAPLMRERTFAGRGEHALDEVHEAAIFEARVLQDFVVRELAAPPDEALTGGHDVDLALHLFLEVLDGLLQAGRRGVNARAQ